MLVFVTFDGRIYRILFYVFLKIYISIFSNFLHWLYVYLGNKQKSINIYINKWEFCNDSREVKFTHVQLQRFILIELVIFGPQ